jgi:hypothetical protein
MIMRPEVRRSRRFTAGIKQYVNLSRGVVMSEGRQTVHVLDPKIILQNLDEGVFEVPAGGVDGLKMRM